MNFDEIMANSILLGPEDKPELQKMQAEIGRFSQMENLPAPVCALAAEIVRDLEKLLFKKVDDFEQNMMEIGQKLAALKDLAGEPSGEPLDSKPGKKTGQASKANPEQRAPEPPKPPKPAEPQKLIDMEILAEFINEAEDHFQVVEANLLSLENNPEDIELINGVFRAFHSTKGMTGFIGLTEAAELAHKAEMLIDRARKGQIKLVGNYADLALEASDTLKEIITAMKDYQGGPLPALPENLWEVRRKLDALESGTSAPIPMGAVARATTPSQTMAIPEPMEGIKPEGIKNKAEIKAPDATIRISTQRLDKLIDMVGELVITNSMVVQNKYIQSEADPVLTGTVMQLNKIARELQDFGVSLRMVPVKATFQKVERLVRDLARKVNKSVNFQVEGEDTEIDRSLVESISDPLVHLVRNALDHGLESAEERVAKGKTPDGKLLLRAYHRAGNVVIELRDDGRGLDRQKIVAKALQNGLISEDKGLEEKEVFAFIFEAGFSTAEKVTDVSGRGVGMDVVRRSIESMHGKVEVASWKDQGTLFSLRIPLTLAIIDGLLIKVDNHEYIVPTLAVKVAVRPEANQLVTIKDQGEMLDFRDCFVPIFRLHELFQLPNAKQKPTEAILLVIEHENESCALMADELLGQQQVVIKAMGIEMKELEYVSGAAILGDGRIRLIIDVAGIMNLACTQNYKDQAKQLDEDRTPMAAVAG